MPGANRLETTIIQLNGDIKSKQSMVDSLQASAKTHAENGDDVRAKTDQDSADRYTEDLNNLQSQIASMQIMMQVKKQKAKSIEGETVKKSSNSKMGIVFIIVALIIGVSKILKI